MSDSSSTKQPNRLIHETSPYLLQHAHNPVDWHPWGDEALSLARDLQKPILLSIGYSACHWCHVMERESFENEAIAALMNEHFVCIKVDREERPDLDEIYMQATLAMNNGQGGWPMTVFLTPEQHPIFAGTYYPPVDRYGRPGFPTLLKKIAEFWKKDPTGLRNQATEITAKLREQGRAGSPMAVGEEELDAAVTQYAEDFDARHGGFGGAPKFPPATGLSFLLRQHHRTGDSHSLLMVKKTLDAMAAGGMYDHIGGGFARYSTDDRWLVPHFEKMLYDNALLAKVYLDAFQATREARYQQVAQETLDYILREMTAPDGGFYSATDADSDGVEGKFFVWTPAEIEALAPSPEDAKRFCAYYDITATGNWEHTNIPNTPQSLEAVAKDLGIAPDDLRGTIDRMKPLVYHTRSTRIAPGLDDKILTGWNGMMISAMAEGARVLGDTRYLEAAEEAADFLLRTMRQPNGTLYRTYRAGKAHLNACLEDYAYLAEGLIDLYEAGAHLGYLDEAVHLVEHLLASFLDETSGSLFSTATDHESLILRNRDGTDGATPSSNAVAASALARLSFHFDREDLRQAATNAIRAYGAQIARYPRAFAKSLCVVDLLLHGPVECALVGTPGLPDFEALKAALNRAYLPNHIIAHLDPAEVPGPATLTTLPLLVGKDLIGGQAALYLCQNFSCEAPITDPTQVEMALSAKGLRSRSEAATSKSLQGQALSGRATAGATGAYAVRFVNDPHHPLTHGYGPLGTTGLTTSRVGFGGYRIDLSDQTYRAALTKALLEGCNLIDTSTNYGDGESERLVGQVIAELDRTKQVTRDSVVVVSKIGYVQGHNLKRAQAREKAGRAYPEMVQYGEDIWHCLHPEFLADQLDLSLDRLSLTTLDVCLLHNPEYFLSDAHHRHQSDLPALRKEFYRRLQSAFVFFEQQVARGRIQFYGVSSNTSTSPHDHPEATSLSSMLHAATAAAHELGIPAHHFRVIQCPMNLFESGALLVRNTGPEYSQTLLVQAQANGVAVLLNRPLNAMPGARGGMIRLASLPLEPVIENFEAQRKAIENLEEEYRQTLAPHIAQQGQGLAPSEYFRWAEELGQIPDRILNLEHWEQIENKMIAPHLNQILRVVTNQIASDYSHQWDDWRNRYLPPFLTLLKILRRDATVKSRQITGQIDELVNHFIPEGRKQESLSRKALWILASTHGVTAVLNGMRTPAYVDDSMEILRWAPLPVVKPLYEQLHVLPLT
jgi:uncharacterized protein YyaL (SSP411 family)/aryl-alcohol dehydrogenase-like predicted oxidoreductase